MAVYDNVFINGSGDAIHIQPHNDVPRDMVIFSNTVVASGTGIQVRGAEGAPYRQRVVANVVAAGMPLQGGEAAHNITLAYRPDWLNVAVSELTSAPAGAQSVAAPPAGKAGARTVGLPRLAGNGLPRRTSRPLLAAQPGRPPAMSHSVGTPANPRSLLWLAALVYTAFVIYGSLVPLEFRAMPWDEAVAKFGAIPFLKLGIGSRADWVANLLLFIPLTYLWMGALTAGGSRLRGGLATLALVPGRPA